MRRTLLLSTLVLFAGCLEADPENAEESLLGGASELDWTLTGCQAVVAIVPVATANIAPYLPAGFRAFSMAEVLDAGLPVDPVGEANFGIEMFTCDNGAGLDGQVPGMDYGSFFAMVEPPADLADENVTYHFVKWDVMIPDQDRREALVEQGIPAVDGSAEYLLFQQMQGPGAYNGALAMDGATHTFTGTAGLPFDTHGSFIEFTTTPSGMATWETGYEWLAVSAGPVVVQPGGGTMAADVMEGPVAGAAFMGTMNFVGGKLTLPA